MGTTFRANVAEVPRRATKSSLPEFSTGFSGFSGFTGFSGNGLRLGRTDPGFPTPGGRMMVVYTNSLRIFYIGIVGPENHRF